MTAPYDIVIYSDVNGMHGWGRDGGAYKIVSELRARGYSAIVINFFAAISIEQQKTIVDKFIGQNTLFVGFATTHFSNITPEIELDTLIAYSKYDIGALYSSCKYFPHPDEYMQELFSLIKTKNADTKIVVGGFKATYNQKFPGVDHWIIGDGDVAAVKLADSLRNNGTFRRVARAAMEYPYNDFNTSRYNWTADDLIQPQEFLPIEIARGCAFNCAFCNYDKKGFGQNIKEMSVLRDEIMYNYETFGTTGYLFIDPLINETQQKMDNLHTMITNLPFKIEWSSFARLDIMNKRREQREQFLEMGARSLEFGIETLNPNVGNIIRKGLHPDIIKDLLYYLNDAWKDEIIMGTGLVVGFPGDTRETIYETLDWVTAPDSPLDSCLISSLMIRPFQGNMTDVLEFPDFSRNPEKFGYKFTSDTEWENEHFTRQEVIQLVDEYCSSERFRNKKKFADYHFYSRVRTLGFTHEECYNAPWADSDFITEAYNRKQVWREKYFEEIMK